MLVTIPATMAALLKALKLVAPVGQVEPPPPLGKPSLKKAPVVWHGTRGVLEHNIGVLKRAIGAEFAREHPDIVADIDKGVGRLDVVLERLDRRLADALTKAHGAATETARKGELKTAKAILAEYLAYATSEPLIGQIDANPFGVFKEVANGGKIIVMGDGMVSLYMTSWEGVQDYQCQEFMQDVFRWLLK